MLKKCLKLFFKLFLFFIFLGFWVLDSTYFEQPKIKFSRSIFLNLETNANQYIWSTYTDLNSQLSKYLLIPYMSVIEFDEDLDGLNDILNLKLKMYTNETIKNFYLVLLFNVEFKVWYFVI